MMGYKWRQWHSLTRTKRTGLPFLTKSVLLKIEWWISDLVLQHPILYASGSEVAKPPVLQHYDHSWGVWIKMDLWRYKSFPHLFITGQNVKVCIGLKPLITDRRLGRHATIYLYSLVWVLWATHVCSRAEVLVDGHWVNRTRPDICIHTTFMVTLQPLKVVEKATILPRCTGLSVEGSLADKLFSMQEYNPSHFTTRNKAPTRVE
jgi:hypothetical protein